MGFKLADLITNADQFDVYECPTGKKGFDTKEQAKKALRKVNSSMRHTMRAFRCDYCERYHLGHRRGARS